MNVLKRLQDRSGDMKPEILQLALDTGLVNYIDNETPRRYFISGNADMPELEEFVAAIEDKHIKAYDHLLAAYERQYKKMMEVKAYHLDQRDQRNCESENPDRMCRDCDCWKQTRAYCG